MTKPVPDGIIARKRGRKINKTLLEEAFPLEYVRNGLNGAKAYKTLKPQVTDKSATVLGSRVLANVSVREKIDELLASAELTVEDAMRVHKRNMEQDEHYPTSQKAVETVYQLKGLIKNNDNNGTPVNVGVFINKE